MIPPSMKRVLRKYQSNLSVLLGLRPPRWALSIPTHLTEEEKQALYKSAFALPSYCVGLEVGSYLGASAAIIGSAIRRRNGKLHCVDTWQNQAMDEPEKDTWPQFQQNVKILGDTIIPHRGFSVEIAKSLDLALDFLFVDGDHSEDAVDRDFRSWLGMVKPGGTVAVHDIGWADGVCKAVDRHLKPMIVSKTLFPNLLICQIR